MAPEPEKLLKVKLINHSALKALTVGQGSKHDWDSVCSALNAAAVMADCGIGEEYLEDIRAGMMAHAQCGKRYYTDGKFGYTGPQLTAVNIALEVHDAQLDIATVGDVERGHMEVKKRLRDKKLSYIVKENV